MLNIRGAAVILSFTRRENGSSPFGKRCFVKGCIGRGRTRSRGQQRFYKNSSIENVHVAGTTERSAMSSSAPEKSEAEYRPLNTEFSRQLELFADLVSR